MTLRVLIAVTHLLGVGHLTRAAAVARAFARAGHQATLVSGGVPAPLISTEDVHFVQLPPVRTTGTAFTTLLGDDGRPVGEERLRNRSEILLAILARTRPHVVITELFPFGRRILAGEFLALLEAAGQQDPKPFVAASVRDILVTPRPSRIEETHGRLTAHYDAVLAHGDPRLVLLDRSWPLADDVRRLVRYTGYVDDGGNGTGVIGAGEGDGVVVSGGGSAASLPLFRAALSAAALVPARSWRILAGQGIADADFAELRQIAPRNAAIERTRPDFRTLLRTAALSVSQAGYNTVVDLLRTGVRSILVPFEGGHETEQRLRAECLAGRGLADLLRENDLSGERLASLATAVLAKPPPPAVSIDLDGAERTVAIIEELVGTRRVAVPAKLSSNGARRQVRTVNWQPLDEALRRAADQGQTITLWWRDDDAVAHTPALDRLLDLSQRFAVPLALAVIPAKVEPSLAERLDGAATAAILVHGLAHANHAPPGEKKAEFGPHRPIGRLRDDAADALVQARNKLGRVLPLFVPPWNRLTPDLVGDLPALGYRGLSTFRSRLMREPAPGLLQVNTHIDPIDWLGTRGLADPGRLVRGFADLIHSQLERQTDSEEPIGLLTHHLVHDEGVWIFCEALLERLAAHAFVRRPFVAEVFSCQGASKP
jgi:predicted glycosyltransferase